MEAHLARAGQDPPETSEEVVLRPSPRSASVSDISSPILAGNANIVSLIDNLINNQTETPARRPRCDPPANTAPVINCNAMEEEEAHELRTRGESGGADDSENEADSDAETLGDDRHLFEEGNCAAAVDESECVTSAALSASNSDRVTPGASEGWRPPGPPSNWKGPTTQNGISFPEFDTIDDPGGWSDFAFQPKCKRDARRRCTSHLHHALPAGATPVPQNAEGKRALKGWEFHCNRWEHDENVPESGSGATKDDTFPEC